MLRSSRDPTPRKQSKISQIKVLWTTELGRVHPLPAIKDEFLHNLLSKERVCPVLPTSAFSNLKLLLQTRPLARSGGSQLGREAAKEAGRDIAFMCSDRMGVCVPSEGHNCTSHTHACTRVHTHTPQRIQQAKPWLRTASIYQAQAGSSLLLIVWMVCYRREEKKNPNPLCSQGSSSVNGIMPRLV